MARKVIQVVIEAEGRDQGKTFVITELSAVQAEKWGVRALAALGQSGADIPDDIANAGLAGIAALGIRAFAGIPWNLLEPLLDEMFSCVQFMPDASRPMVVRRLIDDDTEEIATRLKLRDEVFNLHVGFSIAAALSTLKERAVAAMDDSTSDTPTSPEALVQ